MTTNDFLDSYEPKCWDYAPAVLRVFFNIAFSWDLTDSEQLVFLAISDHKTLQDWRAGQGTTISPVTRQQILHTIAIFQALNTIFPSPVRADTWMRRPNKAPGFCGRSAIDVVMAEPINGLEFIRQYLEVQIG